VRTSASYRYVHRGSLEARSGQLKNFTGIDSPYEPPANPEVYIDTTLMSAQEAAQTIVDRLLGEV